MKEHIYQASAKRIFNQSVFLWLFILMQVYINVDGALTFLKRGDLLAFIFINIIFSSFNIPALILFLKYYRASIDKEFIIAYNSLRMKDVRTGAVIEMKCSDIVKIKLVENARMSRLPWIFHEYFKFIDSQGQEIVVTSYIMDIGDFWKDTLTRKVSSSKLEREQRYYPIM